MSAPASSKLADVASINPRLTSRPADDDLISFVPMSAVDGQTGTTEMGEERAFGEVSKGYTVFSDKDVLVAKITPCFENGKIAQAGLKHRIGVGSTEFHVIRPNQTRLDARYLLHFLRRPQVRVAGERRMTGSAGQRRVPEAFLAGLSVPTPSLLEQKRIADVLDRADELRAKRRESLAHLDVLTQSIFLEMFGGTHSILTDWPTATLGELLDFLTSGSRGWAVHYADHGDLFLRIQNVRGGELLLEDVAYVQAPETAEARRARVEPGDVLLSITADLGRTAVVPDGLSTAYINQHLSILRCSKLEPVYLSAYLSSPIGQDQILRRNRQGVKAGLNFDDVKGVAIPCPPRAIQLKYAERTEAVRRLRTQYRTSSAELDALFASLQDRAFRGLL
ncbi:restriction endonuclease subunit S [Micromonospora sp. NBC_00421]|uniref:restriction endonuclease subunit S n=1 Tax=Micromonospora sp. NBC_00421 TaxID=2975976 RepID=UPI002E1F73BC